MSQITKEALLERGFKKLFKSLDAWGLHMTPDICVILIEGMEPLVHINEPSSDIQVPNCKTLQQLDNLIELFKTD